MCTKNCRLQNKEFLENITSIFIMFYKIKISEVDVEGQDFMDNHKRFEEEREPRFFFI